MAVSNANTVFQPNQVFIPGSNVPTIPVGLNLVRIDGIEFGLDAGATGVSSAAATPATGGASSPGTTPPPAGTGTGTSTGTGTGTNSSPNAVIAGAGGGCTVVTGQTDAGLLLLMLSALAALGLRRRTRRGDQT
jgi:MYXO-CTERM domain-containing protein